MVKVTYTYLFTELSGKPKRYLETKPECTITGYGVSTDTVTLSVLYQNTEVFNTINKAFYNKFKLQPTFIKFV